MFKRLILEEWQQFLPLLGFAIAFMVFVFLSIRAILMKKSDAQRMANLPLEDTNSPSESKTHG